MGNIVGIDLGTTFSALSVLNRIGKPEIIPNSDGDRITPSAIFFDEENSDLVRVGIEAINSRHLNTERSVRWIKRHMGESDYLKQINEKEWSPVELSALILKKLKHDCESEVDEVKDAVISVPAHFDEARRKATMDAGKIAGLNVMGIVNEPVAAALYYATTSTIKDKVMVYDLGGGTFDVTLLDVDNLKMDIICSQGDHHLGGVDFDKKIVEMLEEQYRDEFDAELINSEEERARYEDEAEDIKKTLSRRPVARKMIYGPKGNMRAEITREQFEDAISPLLSRIDMLLEVALEEAELQASDVSDILMVGGSSRIPIVQKKLEEMFGFAPKSTVNVDECVALGAALHAGLIKLREEPSLVPSGITAGLKDIMLTDVCNHSFGTLCVGVDENTGKKLIQNKIMIKKNTPLPCETSQMFYTMAENQGELKSIITQGEDSDPKFVNEIAVGRFELPPNRPAHCPIKVTYSYDVNQRMSCVFEDMDTGKKLEVEFSIDDDGKVTDSKIEEKAKEFETLQVK